MGGFCGNDLSDACGAFAEAVGQELEVGKLVVDGLCELDPALVL
jgi:hypothetical protein